MENSSVSREVCKFLFSIFLKSWKFLFAWVRKDDCFSSCWIWYLFLLGKLHSVLSSVIEQKGNEHQFQTFFITGKKRVQMARQVFYRFFSISFCMSGLGCFFCMGCLSNKTFSLIIWKTKFSIFYWTLLYRTDQWQLLCAFSYWFSCLSPSCVDFHRQFVSTAEKLKHICHKLLLVSPFRRKWISRLMRTLRMTGTPERCWRPLHPLRTQTKMCRQITKHHLWQVEVTLLSCRLWTSPHPELRPVRRTNPVSLQQPLSPQKHKWKELWWKKMPQQWTTPQHTVCSRKQRQPIQWLQPPWMVPLLHQCPAFHLRQHPPFHP